MDVIVMSIFLGLPLLLIAALYAFSRMRRKSGRRPGPAAIVWGNLLVLLTMLSLILLGAETWFRYLRDTTDSFGNTVACERWYERHFHLNDGGFRDDVEYRTKIGAGRRRLTILGDSFAAGHGISDVGDRFANLIRRDRPGLEVHALAVPGSETGAHIQILLGAMRSGYEVDTVVLAYCLNDISDLIPGLGEEYMEAVRGMADKSPFLRHSYFLDFVDSRIRIQRFPIMRNYFGYVRDAYQGPIWVKQENRLTALRRLVEQRGGRFGLLVFPFFDRLDPYPLLEAHQALRVFAAREKIPCLDLLPTYLAHRDEDLVVNAFDAHPNERAHAIAATEILRFLRDLGLGE